jgi:cupin superfamily acireductone dioxygenase involved in methionine salvage
MKLPLPPTVRNPKKSKTKESGQEVEKTRWNPQSQIKKEQEIQEVNQENEDELDKIMTNLTLM